MQNPIRIDLELHPHLRHPLRLRLEFQREPAKAPVVGRLFPLALQHMDQYVLLIIRHGRERLAALHRDRRIARDDHIHQSAKRLDAQRQRRHVQQQQVAEVARQNTALNRRAKRHSFVRILRGVQLRLTVAAAKNLRGEFTHERHP